MPHGPMPVSHRIELRFISFNVAQFLKRQLSLPVSMMSHWCVKRSMAVLASPNTCGQSAGARLVVIRRGLVLDGLATTQVGKEQVVRCERLGCAARGAPAAAMAQIDADRRYAARREMVLTERRPKRLRPLSETEVFEPSIRLESV
jgi:hypothetical protein